MTTPYKAKKKSGIVSIAILFIISSSIVILGAVFGVYAVLNNVSFSVMGSKIPAVVFAAVAMFLGARYFLATMRLWNKIKEQKFSWKNFRKQVNAKPQGCKAFWGSKPGSSKNRETFWGKNQSNVKGEA